MSQHVPEDLLSAFVDGDMGEQLAVHIAEHLDACPSCGARATGLEPLAAAFASVDDPIPPDDLAEAVLAIVAQPERAPRMEIALGAGMLLVAGGLVVTFGNPLGMAVEVGVLVHALGTLGRGLSSAFGSSSFLLSLSTLMAALGCYATMRMAAAMPAAVERRYP